MTRDRSEGITIHSPGTPPLPELLQDLEKAGEAGSDTRAALVVRVLDELHEALAHLDEDECIGQLEQLRRRTRQIDRRDRPPELEPEGGRAVTFAPRCVHPAATVEGEELLDLFRGVSLVLSLPTKAEEERAQQLMREMLLLCDPGFVAERLARERARAAERERERVQREKAEAEKKARGEDVPPTPEEKARAREERRSQWQGWKKRNAHKIEALKNSQPPARPPAGLVTLWAVLDGSDCVVGAGETIEEAHQDAIEEALPYLTVDYLTDGFDEWNERWDRELPFGRHELWRYVRLQGPEDAVWTVAHVGHIR